MRYNEIYPFFGAFSALDPRSTPANAATDHLNAREEDGSIKFRYGFRNLLAAQSNFSALYGMGYLQGYTGASEKEEYWSVETIGANTRIYVRPADDGDPATEVTTSAPASLNVHASEWVATTFDDDAYFINPNNTVPVIRKTIGTAASGVNVAVPDAPTVAPSFTVSYGPGGPTAYSQMTWAGADPSNAGEVACTGAATNTGSSLLSDNTMSIRHTDSDIESSFDVDLSDITAGDQNWTYNDHIYFNLQCETSSFDIDPDSIRVELRNGDGSPKTFVPNGIEVQSSQPGGGVGRLVRVIAHFTNKTRADWDNVAQFKVTYKVTRTSSTVANNDLIVSAVTLGGVYVVPPRDVVDANPSGDNVNLELVYSYYDSVLDFESGVSPILTINAAAMVPGNRNTPGSTTGHHLEITTTVSGDAAVDNFRLYARLQGQTVWRRVATQLDSDLTYDYKTAYYELTGLTEYEPAPFDKDTLTANVTNAFPYKGSMCWLYQTGSENVRFSRIGEPLKQASDTDSDDDTEAGETFTLADNAGDEPLGGIQAGDGVMIAGKNAVHAMIGDRPVEMTPPRKVAGSYGVAGKYAYCRWKDDSGTVGMAYMSRDGQVMFSIPGSFTNKSEMGGTVNLSELVRDGELSPKDFLLEEQASALSLTDFSTCQVFADEQQDALWVVMGKRAMVLRRANLLSGARYWEHYEYTTGGATVTFRYCSGSGKRRLRFMRSDGKFDEIEYNSSTRAYISGSNSDGGSAAPAGYWESKTFVGPNRRINFVAVERDDYTDTPTVTVYSSRTPAGNAKTIASGSKGVRFDPADQGETYRVRVSIAETYEPFRRIKIEEFAAGRRRNA